MATFSVDDICAWKSQTDVTGIIEKTHADIDTHDPEPERILGSRISRHSRISRIAFSQFRKDGVPPKNTVLVVWDASDPMLVPESELLLLERPMMVGDTVKRCEESAMSGTVLHVERRCSLRGMGEVVETRMGKSLPTNWYTLLPEETPHMTLKEGSMIHDVPASELRFSHEYNEADIILYRGWVGRIRDVTDEVTLRLLDNSVVVPFDDLELEPIDPIAAERFTVGDLTKTRKACLRRGRWVYGQYNPNLVPIGVVCKVRAIEIEVDWLSCMEAPSLERPQLQPVAVLGLDELESDDLIHYDPNRRPQADISSSPTRIVPNIELNYGLRVQFRDFTGACVKYSGDRSGRISRLERNSTLGYDMNIFVVTSVSSEAVVQWQDLSTTTERCTTLVHDYSDDDNTAYPGDKVCSQDNICNEQTDWTVQPKRVGIVQSVNAIDRVAQIRWCPNTRVRFLEDEEHTRLPGSPMGSPGDIVEEVSLYDLHVPSALNARRGDFILVPPDNDTTFNARQCVGEVMDVNLDGSYTVRLGCAFEIRDISVSPDDAVILLRAEDVESSIDDDEMSYVDGDIDLDDLEREDMEYIMDNDHLGLGMADDDDDEDTNSWMTETDANESEMEHDLIEQHEKRTTPMFTLSSQLPHIPPPSEPLFREHASLPAPYTLLDGHVPESHHFKSGTTPVTTKQARAIRKEHDILSKASILPDGVYVRSWEQNWSLFRILFVGPVHTPYEFAPFVFDIELPSMYPDKPPKVHFHSWISEGVAMQGRVNPNLYEDGKVCLSLLGTWGGDEHRGESWVPGKSTMLQLLVSILGLVLVSKPYYNEAGYEALQGLPSSRLASALYTERTYIHARGFLLYAVEAVRHGTDSSKLGAIEDLADVVTGLYLSDDGPTLLKQAVLTGHQVLKRSQQAQGSEQEDRDGLTVISKGACLLLQRALKRLESPGDVK